MQTNNKETLKDEHHPLVIEERIKKGPDASFLADAVLGGIDGAVTTFAVVAASIGGGFTSLVALVLGLANLVADGFSMAVSNYQALQSKIEEIEHFRKMEEHHIEKIPEGEREEIRQIYQQKGFQGDDLERVVSVITNDKKLWVDTMLQEEWGLHLATSSPIKGAAATFIAFLVVGLIPLIPFIFSQNSIQELFPISCFLTGSAFFGIGAVKGYFLNRSIFKSGVVTLLLGGAAASLSYLVGWFIRRQFGV